MRNAQAAALGMMSATPMTQPTVHQIHACPFSQRLEILLALKCRPDAVRFEVIDITKPRPDWLLKKTAGTTALPALEIDAHRVLKESLVILQYLDDTVPGRTVAQRDPYRRAIENMLVRVEGDFGNSGYALLKNRDPARRKAQHETLLRQYRRLDDFLMAHAPDGTFLFEEFGWAEAVFTPFFMRFLFLAYYEDFELPDDSRYTRVRRWRDACLAHPAAQQVCREEIVKLYYDYTQGAGNGALPPGRARSSFSFDPPWRDRPWPPKDKYRHAASDAELGL